MDAGLSFIQVVVTENVPNVGAWVIKLQRQNRRARGTRVWRVDTVPFARWLRPWF